MNNENVSSTQIASASSLHSYDMSSKYQGIIEQSTYKKARNALFQLFDYVSLTVPSFFGLHIFICIWRIAQFFGASLASNYIHYWNGPDSIMYKFLNIFSIVFYIMPGEIRPDYGYILLYIITAIFIAFYIFIGIAAAYLQHNAKLPFWMPVTISIFFSTFGYIVQNVVSMTIGEIISVMIQDPDNYANAINIVAVILVVLTSTVYAYLYSSMYSISIIFKPDSLMSAVPSVQVNMSALFSCITLVVGIASHLDRIPRLILTLIAAILYVLSILMIFQKGSFIQELVIKAVTATSATSAIHLIFVIGFEAANKSVEEYMIVIIILLWVISFVIVHFIIISLLNKRAKILDRIEEDNEYAENIKRPSKFISLIVTGFRLAHPICVNFQLLKIALERYPKNADLWMVFAKFTAIYPEETQQLSYIAVGLMQNRIKNSLAKYTHQQIKAIIRQRETNLIPELKTKLDRIGKQVQATKHKVRYIWDLIIQGNIKELESVINRAYTSIDSNEAEFLHLLHQFPNSRFVARAYARFLRDVVADHAGHKIWAQNVSLLQRGINVATDQAHDLGIRAFPNLPVSLDSKMQVQSTPGMITDDTITQDIDEDEHAAIDAELRMSVRESINRLKIPSYKYSRIIRIVMFVIFFLAPVIAITVYIPIYIDQIMQPLSYMYYISELRTLCFQNLGSAYHFVLENLESYNPLMNTVSFPVEPNGGIEGEVDPPESFGGFYDSRLQAEYLNNQLSAIMPYLTSLMSYKVNDPIMEQVRQALFGENMMFLSISDPEYVNGYDPNSTMDNETIYTLTPSLKSAQSAIMQFIININKIIQHNEIPENIHNLPECTIPFNNARATEQQITSAINYILQYIQELNSDTQNSLTIALIVICIAIPILYVLSCVYIITKTEKEKLMIYKCLASLPKNVVSRVADSFKVLKKDDDDEIKTGKTHDEELNKQEENMLKIFSTSSDATRGKAADNYIIISISIVIALLHVALTIVILMFIKDSSSNQNDVAPHIDFVTGAYAYDLASVIIAYALIGASNPYSIYHIINFDIQILLYVFTDWQSRSIENYRTVKYGNTETGTVPFSSLGATITSSNAASEACKVGVKPSIPHQCYACWSADLLLSYSQMKFESYITTFSAQGKIFNGNDYYLKHLWHIHQVHIYDSYFSKMFDQLIPMLNDILNQRRPLIIAVSYCILVIVFLCEVVLIRYLYISENRQKFALRLLLHCPGNVVVSNSHITALLSGNFHEKQIDSTLRDAEFYEILVKDMPDSIIICDIDGIIQTVNNATKRIYSVEPSELVGKHIATIGDKFNNGNPFKEIFDKTEKVNTETCLVYKDEEGNDVHLEMAFTVLGESCLVTTRDVTQTVNYNMLISDEKAKSDKLLSSILPARLVPRVQAGEKNISFAVQSVTIIFMDIVSFTPWCGSEDAATVMKTLNILFKEYDSLCLHHTTMTKIKCIGDCYMGAGGIFAEINQPAVHAKDVVEFGLDAIESLEEINARINQKLQIRVGINTGGPIVAGVLGTEKPTFEILGPTINMAQQMEHHGIPMKVHISRAVYELIYGGSFDVKERGEIEIKNGTVVTYVINKRTHK